jgi:hypothetical protein
MKWKHLGGHGQDSIIHSKENKQTEGKKTKWLDVGLLEGSERPSSTCSTLKFFAWELKDMFTIHTFVVLVPCVHFYVILLAFRVLH